MTFRYGRYEHSEYRAGRKDTDTITLGRWVDEDAKKQTEQVQEWSERHSEKLRVYMPRWRNTATKIGDGKLVGEIQPQNWLVHSWS